MKLLPEILCQPNIPKPLHGLNPRSIKGKDWWDKKRKEAYASTNYNCIACGVHKTKAKKHQWLEAHEFWNIDYKTGICEVIKIVPLCHYCHNFIHNGRLYMIMGKEKTWQEVTEILEHGFYILSQNNLKAFPHALELAKFIGAKTYNVKAYKLPEHDTKWENYVMILEGETYKSKFKDYFEWEEYYNK